VGREGREKALSLYLGKLRAAHVFKHVLLGQVVSLWQKRTQPLHNICNKVDNADTVLDKQKRGEVNGVDG